MKKLILSCILSFSVAVSAHAKDSFSVAWSHYAGWEPWGYADHAGIIDKWAKKEGIEIDVTLVNDYIESINLYTSGQFDACTMTNMDALTIPAVGGVDSEAVIVGDYSNGNDGIVVKNADSLQDLRSRKINLVELSVSHYLLARALDTVGMGERDVTLVNTSDADIAALFTNDPNGAAVTWNPPLMEARQAPGAKVIFDSSQIPGEILDLMVVKTSTDPRLKRALIGAWYEVLQLVKSGDPKAMEWLAASSGTNVAGYKAQLKTTAMFWTPREAIEFVSGPRPRNVMDKVRAFSFEKGLFGETASSPDFVGIAFDDDSTMGSKRNVKMRFTSKYMAEAIDK
ncbi:putative urea ABC transporter substrate-binding protein [Sedimenticola sp.]|uniref:putative urea ABC transporter substrate-binding protein n=1 Tax=Sedimenticola sp. TaxID=1940285 RepID=UPI003D0F5CD5